MDLLLEYKKRVDAEIEKFFSDVVDKYERDGVDIVDLLKHLAEVGSGGKRLRGFLFLVGYALGNGVDEFSWDVVDDRLLRASMGLEIFHLGLLVQDDVMDESDTRRGVPSIHSRYDDLHYGESMANLAGDLCYGWMVDILSSLDSVDVLREWSRYFVRVVVGQTLDVKIQEKILGIDDYPTVVRLKTAEYTGEMPLVLGWLTAGGSKEEGKKIFEWGRDWGMLFQWVDDVDDGDGLIELVGLDKSVDMIFDLSERLKSRVDDVFASDWWRDVMKDMVVVLEKKVEKVVRGVN